MLPRLSKALVGSMTISASIVFDSRQDRTLRVAQTIMAIR